MTDTTTTMDAIARAQKFVNDMLAMGENAYWLLGYAERMKADSARLADYASEENNEEAHELHMNAMMLWGCIADILREDVFDTIDPVLERGGIDPVLERIQMQADKDIAELRESLQPYGEDED